MKCSIFLCVFSDLFENREELGYRISGNFHFIRLSCRGAAFDNDLVSIQRHLELWNFSARHSLAKPSTNRSGDSFWSVILRVKPCNKSDLLDVPFLLIPHMILNVTFVVFQVLKRQRVTFNLAKWDASKDPMDNSECNLLNAGRVGANRLLM